MNAIVKVLSVPFAADIATPMLPAQGPGVGHGTASPFTQTLWTVAAIALVLFLIAGVVRGAICYWRGARR
jgi:hypothetical protein